MLSPEKSAPPRRKPRKKPVAKAKNSLKPIFKAPWRNVAFGVYYGGSGEYLYQPITKCACTTIKTLLLEMEGLQVEKNVWKRHKKTYNKFPGITNLPLKEQRDIVEGRTDTFKFVIVRNPYTRLSSAYRDKFLAKPRNVWSDKIRRSAAAHGIPLSAEITFAEFVDVVCRQSVREMDIHWRPQFFQGHFDQIRFDYIGRFERMPADLVTILERIGAPRSLIARAGERHNDSGAGTGIELWRTVPNELRRRFVAAYAVDFDTFGYSRELPDPEDLAGSIVSLTSPWTDRKISDIEPVSPLRKRRNSKRRTAVMASIEDLKTWLERDLRFATWKENVQVQEASEQKLSIKLYTDINEYTISGEAREDGELYISATAKSRKPRAGLAESRVRHLLPEPAKPLNPRIWRKLLGAIVGLELVRVHRRENAESAAEPEAA